MAITKYNPFWEFDGVRDTLNKMLEYPLMQFGLNNDRFVGFLPSMDILEDEQNIYIEAEVPGVKKEDIKITVNDENVLTIKGEKKFEQGEGDKVCFRNERIYGSFTRSLKLSGKVNTEKIEARCENGILYLTIPRLEPARLKEQAIEIQ